MPSIPRLQPPFLTPLTRASPLPLTRPPHRTASTTSDWQGRQANEHLANRKDSLNVQASASKSGKNDRAAGEGQSQSQATGEADHRDQNQQAKKDHPEAPGPVIGMNDERGGKGHK